MHLPSVPLCRQWQPSLINFIVATMLLNTMLLDLFLDSLGQLSLTQRSVPNVN